MKFLPLPTLLLLGGLCVQRLAAQAIPPPTGKYNVGRRRQLIDFINPDPVSPNNVSTAYLATLYYPTPDDPAPAAPYLEPELAELYAEFNYSIAGLTSTLRWNASFLPECSGPTILSGPGGWGAPTDGQVLLLSELASHGYVAVGIDHIYEQPFLRLPNGTGVYGLPVDYDWGQDLSFLEALHATRVRENLHFIAHLPALVQALGAPFQTDSVGTMGHSLGGSAALATALESDRVAAAINEDGSHWGRLTTADSDLGSGKAALLLGFEQHTAETDASWRAFAEHQTGWWRLLTVDGAAHADFSDVAFWREFGTRVPPPGSIPGRRMVQVRREYVRAFFDEMLMGEERDILDEPAEEWPEVNYIVVHDGGEDEEK